jgi:hypothetical protein
VITVRRQRALARRAARRRRLARRVLRTCFVLSATAAVALPIVWFGTRPPADVGVLTGIGPAATVAPRADEVSADPGWPPIRTYPARLLDQPARAVNPPVAVHIPDLGVDARSVPVGVTPGSALLETPSDPTTLGWYRHGPVPGDAGSALIAGHVDYNGRPGAFFGLRRLEPGATITVDHADGSSRIWRVVARRQYAKDELPADLVFARSGAPTLTLVTCGGLFDASKRSYRDNVVVFATPAT